jgi:hypothetical protein
MDKKIDIDVLKSILREHLEAQQQAAILKEINNILTEEEEEKLKEQGEKPPKVPKKSVIILTSLPDGVTEKDLEHLAGFITEIPEDARTKDLKGQLLEVKNAYNQTKKAKKNPANTLGELFEAAGGKLFKENGVQKKPKGPLEFIFCPNRA